jgi:hypothetical protein
MEWYRYTAICRVAVQSVEKILFAAAGPLDPAKRFLADFHGCCLASFPLCPPLLQITAFRYTLASKEAHAEVAGADERNNKR